MKLNEFLEIMHSDKVESLIENNNLNVQVYKAFETEIIKLATYYINEHTKNGYLPDNQLLFIRNYCRMPYYFRCLKLNKANEDIYEFYLNNFIVKDTDKNNYVDNFGIPYYLASKEVNALPHNYDLMTRILFLKRDSFNRKFDSDMSSLVVGLAAPQEYDRPYPYVLLSIEILSFAFKKGWFGYRHTYYFLDTLFHEFRHTFQCYFLYHEYFDMTMLMIAKEEMVRNVIASYEAFNYFNLMTEIDARLEAIRKVKNTFEKYFPSLYSYFLTKIIKGENKYQKKLDNPRHLKMILVDLPLIGITSLPLPFTCDGRKQINKLFEKEMQMLLECGPDELDATDELKKDIYEIFMRVASIEYKEDGSRKTVEELNFDYENKKRKIEQDFELGVISLEEAKSRRERTDDLYGKLTSQEYQERNNYMLKKERRK